MNEPRFPGPSPLAAMAFAALLGSVPLLATVPDYPYQGRWSVGPTVAIEHWRSGDDSLLFAGEGTGLTIRDVSDPADPILLGTVDTGAPVWEIEISDDGDRAAVADRLDWLTLIDVSDRSAPVVLGRYEFVGGTQPWGIDLVGDLAYVAARGEGLWVIDIADPTTMDRIGRFLDIGTELVPDVKVLGDTAFLADDREGVAAIDVSDPTAPVFADRFVGADYATEITLDGTLAYVTRKQDGLTILDLSAAPAMTELGTIDPGGLLLSTAVVAPGLVVSAESAILSTQPGLHFIDVSNPAMPTVVATALDIAIDVTADGEVVFAMPQYDREPPTLFAFDADTSAPYDAPTLLGTTQLAGENVDVLVAGDVIVVANERGGGFVVDASDIAAPTTLARLDVGTTRVDRLAQVGDTLAFVSTSNHLGLIDLSDRTDPVNHPDFAIEGDVPYDLVRIPGVQGVAVAASDDGVRMINLSVPSVPFEAGSWVPATGGVVRVDMDGDRLVAAGNTDVWVLDASTPTAPVETASFTVSNTVLDIAVEGDHAYLAVNGAGSVAVWDVSTATPSEVATIDVSPPTNANGIAIRDGRIYIAADARVGLMVWDISDPADPFELATIDTPGVARAAAVGENLVAVADGLGGVEIWSSAPPLGRIFDDGFETGDTSEWSSGVR